MTEVDINWKMALKQVPHGVALIDSMARILWCNAAFESMTGYAVASTRETDLIGLRPLFPDSGMTEEMLLAIRQGRPFTGGLCGHRKDGDQFWCDVSVVPVGAADTVQSICFLTDTSERKKEVEILTDAYRRLEGQTFALDQHAIVAMTDLNGRITYANDKFCAISGYSRDELLGQDHRRLNSGVHPKSFFADMWRTIASGGVWHGEICNRAKNGSYYWVYSTIMALPDADSRLRAYIAIRTDITQRKEAEAKLSQAKAESDRLNRKLHDKTVEAERASQAKSEFLANMCHEIRTPMNGVLGMLQLLRHTSLTSEQEDFVRTALTSGEALLTLLNDILDFSRIAGGRMQLESLPFSTGQLVYEVAELFRPREADGGVELLVRVGSGVPEVALGDPARIRQILGNLVGNAVKFTESGHILIDLDWKDAAFTWSVSDTGIGIPTESLSRLFAPFVQGDTSIHRRFGGTGLGLAISRRLAELMGGSLSVTSTPGQGSTFVIRLALALPEAASSPGAQSPDRDLLGLPILVVDDNPVSGRIILEQLSRLGANGELIESPALALSAIAGNPAGGARYAAVIVDQHMPVLSGGDLVRAIRADPDHVELPIVLMSAVGVRGEVEWATALGVAGYLTKPFSTDLLGLVLKNVIKRGDSREVVTRFTLRQMTGLSAPPLPALHGDIHLLVVEDHPVNQRLLALFLTQTGARVSLANDGVQALERLKKERFDAVFMDCQMPIMDGYATAVAIREREATEGAHRVPIIAMTANAMSGDRERCLAAGMDDYISKPINESELAQVINRWLGLTQCSPSAGGME